ncbi:MAG: hypothetical protein B9S32_09115 [Verrucomicrobia bacterium Tous-C9LFEB]|nr:MAG: hypothetical protein B9S32_09115 [Verrucomicrobia bacterium Tous-C9LFEB]
MPDASRPDPDQLLASLQKEEAQAKRGRLKIFFGMCPGVGKTYAMLKAARQQMQEGTDVVVGLIETHGRAETAALIEGLVVAERKKIDYRGTVLEEMDVEGILFLQPQLVLVDELAHTNAPGLRHVKRYQDVDELLAAGIDVYTTLNVQHIESRADTVRQITGAPVHETVPDSVLEWADEIELIDITPERLRERLAEGKVYLGPRADMAAAHFFKETNLTALRELALRLTAERVDQQLRSIRQREITREVWKSGDRLMVAVGPSPFSLQLVRWTRRMAYAMNAPWMAVHVESNPTLSPEAKQQLDRNLSTARELGAEVVLTHDVDSAAALVRIAREHNVSQIVVGKPRDSWWMDVLRGGGLVNRLIRQCGHIDVYVVPAEAHKAEPSPLRFSFSNRTGWKEYLNASASVVGVTLFSLSVGSFTGYWAVALIYLFLVILLSLVLNRGPVFVAATLSALTWNYLFIPPKYTFIIATLPDTLMFGMYFVIALVTGHLTSRLRLQQRNERERELRAIALYRLIRTVATARTISELLDQAATEIESLFQAKVAFFTTEAEQPVTLDPHPASRFAVDDKEISVALWTFRNGRSAGRFTDTLPAAEGYYVPLRAGEKCLGVMGIKLRSGEALLLQQRDILESFAGQIGLALEREKLRAATQATQLALKSETLQKTLFNSISHELRTPLSVIQAATSQLSLGASASSSQPLLEEIKQATTRLDRLVQNLLNSARLESDQLQAKMEWGDVEDVVTGAVQLMKGHRESSRIQVNMAPKLPLIHADFGLLQQALMNLIDNALNYTPEGSPVHVSAAQDRDSIILCVEDEGSGLSPETLAHLFEKFYRASDARPGGTGLGLSIAKHFVEVNRGQLTAANRETSGAIFTIRLPILNSPAKLNPA